MYTYKTFILTLHPYSFIGTNYAYWFVLVYIILIQLNWIFKYEQNTPGFHDPVNINFAGLFTYNIAAVITYGSYSLDTGTNIVTGDGLEWLQWDDTIGESIDSIQSVLNIIEGGNWTIAPTLRDAELFYDFGFGLTLRYR